MGLHGLIGRHGCRQVWVKPVPFDEAVERLARLHCEHDDGGEDFHKCGCWDWADYSLRAALGGLYAPSEQQEGE
jgi:hypothetical protein